MFIRVYQLLKKEKLLQLSRKKVRKTVGLLTGHFFNKDFHLIEILEIPTYKSYYKDDKNSQLRYLELQFLEIVKKCPIHNALKFMQDTKLSDTEKQKLPLFCCFWLVQISCLLFFQLLKNRNYHFNREYVAYILPEGSIYLLFELLPEFD